VVIISRDFLTSRADRRPILKTRFLFGLFPVPGPD
jgi:hypothetical protein